MERRTFLTGGSAAVVGLATGPAYAQYVDGAWLKPTRAATARPV